MLGTVKNVNTYCRLKLFQLISVCHTLNSLLVKWTLSSMASSFPPGRVAFGWIACTKCHFKGGKIKLSMNSMALVLDLEQIRNFKNVWRVTDAKKGIRNLVFLSKQLNLVSFYLWSTNILYSSPKYISVLLNISNWINERS